MERFLPDNYTKTLVGSVVDQSVLTELIKTYLPNLSSHMESLHLEVSTFTVPWFLCIYLNTLSLPIATKILDCFFLEGPKILFWVAMAVLTVNEKALIEQGRDDDIFVAVLKDYFSRLAVADPKSTSFDGEALESSDESTLTGKELYSILIDKAINHYGPLITNEVIDSMRMKARLKVVHGMEANNRKSQIRILSEQCSLSSDEISIVYDIARGLEYEHDDIEEYPDGPAAIEAAKDYACEEQMRIHLAGMGGWGLVRNYRSHENPASGSQKSISLKNFRKIFKLVSPLRAGSMTKDNMNELSIIDRIYYYCSFQYNFVHKQKRASSEANIGYFVDLAAVTQVLDAIMKQQLNSRLRFLFDLFDIDGDGYLNDDELKAMMDAFLEMFQSSKITSAEQEKYLKSLATFLSACLKMGDKPKESFNKLAPKIPKSDTVKSKRRNESFYLSFNEFLMAVLSQAIFVEYFELIWSFSLDKDQIKLISSRKQLKPQNG